MASTKQILTRDNIFGGVDSDNPPHVVEDQKWTVQHQLRSFRGNIQQIPQEVFLTGTLATADEVQDIVNIPTGNGNECLIVALTLSTIYQLRPTNITNSVRLYTHQYQV